MQCPECHTEVVENKGSPVSPYINTYACPDCSWGGLRCGDTRCDGYLKPGEMVGFESVRYNCVKCGWTGVGPPMN